MTDSEIVAFVAGMIVFTPIWSYLGWRYSEQIVKRLGL